MGAITKSARRRPDRIAQLTAQVQALTARLAALEATPEPSENGNSHKVPQSRRDRVDFAAQCPGRGDEWPAGCTGQFDDQRFRDHNRPVPDNSNRCIAAVPGDGTGRSFDDYRPRNRFDNSPVISERPADWRN